MINAEYSDQMWYQISAAVQQVHNRNSYNSLRHAIYNHRTYIMSFLTLYGATPIVRFKI